MAQTLASRPNLLNRSPQVPQHVSALLSHLTSRPGVQSTLILSRKDGSIIQSTGLLAVASGSGSSTPGKTMNTDKDRDSTVITKQHVNAPTDTSSSDLASPTTSSHQESTSSPSAQNNNSNTQQSYKPSQAELLAAHIFAFMTSASGLALSLSGTGSSEEIGFESRSRSAINGTATPAEDDSNSNTTEKRLDETAAPGREEDDEIKLLRLRTKKHEIVVVPDRKYLLCVVHDASGATATAAAGGGSR